MNAAADSTDTRGGATRWPDDNDRSLIEVLVTNAIRTLTRHGVAVERVLDPRRPAMPTLLVSRQSSPRATVAPDRTTDPDRRPSGLLLVFHVDHWAASAATRHAFLRYVGDRHMPVDSLATAVIAMLADPEGGRRPGR
jgi:hypothetical protein